MTINSNSINVINNNVQKSGNNTDVKRAKIQPDLTNSQGSLAKEIQSFPLVVLEVAINPSINYPSDKKESTNNDYFISENYRDDFIEDMESDMQLAFLVVSLWKYKCGLNSRDYSLILYRLAQLINLTNVLDKSGQSVIQGFGICQILNNNVNQSVHRNTTPICLKNRLPLS